MKGALSAMAGHRDFFGAMVLSFCTALGGEIIRDLLIGAIPPGSMRDWRYSVLYWGTKRQHSAASIVRIANISAPFTV